MWHGRQASVQWACGRSPLLTSAVFRNKATLTQSPRAARCTSSQLLLLRNAFIGHNATLT